MDEKQLLTKAIGGDIEAFERLAIRHEGMAYALSLRLMGNAEDAKDATQSALIKAYNALGSFRGDCSFSSWLYRIAYNICMDMLRRKKPASSLEALAESGILLAYAGPTAEEEAEKRERRDMLLAGIQQLDAKSREMILLRDIDGLSYEEIADALRLNLGTVKSRLNRSRLKLRRLLEEKGML